MMGSSNVGPALAMASLKAMLPHILKAFSLESTSWKEPSMSVALMSTTS